MKKVNENFQPRSPDAVFEVPAQISAWKNKDGSTHFEIRIDFRLAPKKPETKSPLFWGGDVKQEIKE